MKKTFKLRPARLIRAGDLMKDPETGAEVRVLDVLRCAGEVSVGTAARNYNFDREQLVQTKRA